MLKILIVKLSAIGDVIHCLPVAAQLKQSIPESHIAWLVEETSAELLTNNGAIDEVIVFDGKTWFKDARNPLNWPKLVRHAANFFRQLRAKNFDIALEMQGLFKSGLMALTSGARIRMGFDGTREFAEQFLTHRVKVGDYFGHDIPVVELNLKIAEALLHHLHCHSKISARFVLPNRRFDLLPKVAEAAGATYILNDFDRSPTVMHESSRSKTEKTGANPKLCVLIPGTTWDTKIWPLDHWLELGLSLRNGFGYKLLIVGSKSELLSNSQLAWQLNADSPESTVDLTGKTSLLELAALFEVTDLVVGGDTGPLHLAAAVNRPYVVGIYGSTPRRRNGPYGSQCISVCLNIACQPCYSKHCKIGTIRCLKELSVQNVLDSIGRLVQPRV